MSKYIQIYLLGRLGPKVPSLIRCFLLIARVITPSLGVPFYSKVPEIDLLLDDDLDLPAFPFCLPPLLLFRSYLLFEATASV